MTEEGFKQFLRPYVEQKIPFLAYWHPQGFGLIRLDKVMVPDIPKGAVNALGVSPSRPHTLTRGGRRTWESNLARLKKQTWGRVITVEFDGETIKTEGGFEL